MRDDDLDRAWERAKDHLVSGVCHGDYYRRNVLVADRQVRGVIDWHDAYVGPLIGEVAFAAWEFGHDEDLQLNRPMFDLFLAVYEREASHLPATDYASVPVAVRVQLRDNILWALSQGASPEDEYQQKQAEAFWALKSSLV
jgi:Ser/Thr protein kinase RdoA (MazF antagonist)